MQTITLNNQINNDYEKRLCNVVLIPRNHLSEAYETGLNHIQLLNIRQNMEGLIPVFTYVEQRGVNKESVTV